MWAGACVYRARNPQSREKRKRPGRQALRRPKMKTLANRLIVAVSALVLGSAAYGQTDLKAHIPFPFQTANATLPAGDYRLIRQSGNDGIVIMKIWNTDSHRGVLAMSGAMDRNVEGTPRLVFRYEGGEYTLRQIRTAVGTTLYPVRHKPGHKGETTAEVFIPLVAQRGE